MNNEIFYWIVHAIYNHAYQEQQLVEPLASDLALISH